MTDDPLAALTAKFMARCATNLVELRAMAAAGDPPEAVLRPLVHRLAGTAGMFGLAEVSAAAAAIDSDLVDGKPAGGDELDALIQALSRALSGP